MPVGPRQWSYLLTTLASTPRSKTSEGQAVGAGSGTVYLDYLKAQGFSEVKELGGLGEAIAAFETGEIKAYMTNGASIAYQKSLGERPEVRLVETYVPVITSEGGIAVRAADTELLDQINASLADLKADWTIETMADKWKIQP